jgi:hypothetical protein
MSRLAGFPGSTFQTDVETLIPAGIKAHSETMEQSRAGQRRVNSRLTVLECLEALCLGSHSPTSELVVIATKNMENDKVDSVCYDPGLQQTCLEWTLASGLGHLAPFRYLQVLGLENMKHREDLVDLEWMQRHQPRRRSFDLKHEGRRYSGDNYLVLLCPFKQNE